MRFSFLQKQAAKELIAHVLHEIKTNKKAAAISFSDIHTSCSKQARKLSGTICSLRPTRYGINRSAVSPKEADNLVVIQKQTYVTADGQHEIPPRLVPRHTFRAFQAMNHSMKKDINHSLVIQSGYRSPAYQLFIFLFQLQKNNWDVKETMQTVALPGYSEHADSTSQALDLRASRFLGPHDCYDFSRVPSYRWMQKNAQEFGFSLSYPEGNGTGTKFEPWHWQHE